MTVEPRLIWCVLIREHDPFKLNTDFRGTI